MIRCRNRVSANKNSLEEARFLSLLGESVVKDYMHLALAKKDGVRSYAAATTALVEEARRRHGTSPTATVALGRALTATALMSGLLKVGQRVALKLSLIHI